MSQGLQGFVGQGAGRRDVRLLFTCAGRRIELIEAFTRAARRLGLRPVIHTADIQRHYAAACVSDAVHHTPPAGDRGYVPALARIVRRHRIDMLIPLVDTELPVLSRARETFAGLGCAALISPPAVIGVCRDKLQTFRFLQARAIDTPPTWPIAEVLRSRSRCFPYFLKPRCGSASRGSFIIRGEAELRAFARIVPDGILQRFVAGTEHTLDVYTGFDGRCRCVVPRRRLEVRGGEVTTGLTVRHAGIIRTGVRVAEALADCVGLITIQLFLTPEGTVEVIEINPRFGGGAPLSIAAGADFPRWLLGEWQGRRPRIRLDHFREGVMMLRYHQSFFLESVRPPAPKRSGP